MLNAQVSPTGQHVPVVLESVKGLLLFQGAHNYVAQQASDAPLSAIARHVEETT